MSTNHHGSEEMFEGGRLRKDPSRGKQGAKVAAEGHCACICKEQQGRPVYFRFRREGGEN